MQALVVGDVLNYFTGERLPVVMAKVKSVKINKDETEILVNFETSSQFLSGTFRFSMTVRDALSHGAVVPIAVRFVRKLSRSMGADLITIPTAVMVGLSEDAHTDPEGDMVYSLDAHTF